MLERKPSIHYRYELLTRIVRPRATGGNGASLFAQQKKASRRSYVAAFVRWRDLRPGRLGPKAFPDRVYQ